MATMEVCCPNCNTTNVVKYGRQANGAQRYRCQNLDCERTVFLTDYKDRVRLPEIKRQIIEMALSGSGIRDTARTLGVSPGAVIEVFELLANFGASYRGGTASGNRSMMR
ncbi:MAG: IS1 family transposase [Magnetococcales bacterium]|nr:IS1 family transposase [Magnetococcales bacterium]